MRGPRNINPFAGIPRRRQLHIIIEWFRAQSDEMKAELLIAIKEEEVHANDTNNKTDLLIIDSIKEIFGFD